MSLPATLGALILAVAALGLSLWRARRPPTGDRAPLVPHGVVQFVALVAIVALLGHLVSLLTGQPFTGRGGP
ncbi:MAG: hypothetical protein FJX56_14245 [Alphaproteobacteria bacterium]|nr:hypothetical protein [Alphaproteobacteria bacterium]